MCRSERAQVISLTQKSCSEYYIQVKSKLKKLSIPASNGKIGPNPKGNRQITKSQNSQSTYVQHHPGQHFLVYEKLSNCHEICVLNESKNTWIDETKRHKCTSCGKDFANKAVLDSHIDLHHLDETRLQLILMARW